MLDDASISTLALVVTILLAGCLGGPIPEQGASEQDSDVESFGGIDRGTIFVHAADQPPEVPPVPHTNETVQSTESIQTALDRYREGESGLFLHVEGGEYDETRAALQQLVDGTAPAWDYGSGPNTYVELEDSVVRVGVTINATAGEPAASTV